MFFLNEWNDSESVSFFARQARRREGGAGMPSNIYETV